MEFSFFTTNNKSGYKTQEKWFSINHSDEYSNIIQYTQNIDLDLSFKEKIWFYFNKLTERPKCISCKGEIKFRERFDKPYGDFCSLRCINENKEEMVIRQKKTFQKKYGIDYYPMHEDFMNKQKKTKLEKYGNEYYNNMEKNKESRKLKYGNENYVNHEKYKMTCLEKYGVLNYSHTNNYRNYLFNFFKEKYSKLNIIDINKQIIRIKCHKCHEEMDINKWLVDSRYKVNMDVCIKCNPIGQKSRSSYEIKLCEFLDIYKIQYEPSYRKILGKKEIDIFLSEKMIGIEVNGVYWHNELFFHKNDHLKKMIECKKQNVNLIHFFEDEVRDKIEIVKSILKNKLDLIDQKIYARKCIIKEVSFKNSKIFLDENHIQGNVISGIRIGLFYNNELISLMTFSRGRIIMGGKTDEYELTRFCNKINTNVIGGASKLFKYFIKTYNPNKIVSFSDIRLFNGGLYEKLGFKFKSQSRPNYWYVINGMRYHRFNYTKGSLIKDGYSPELTEHEIMLERGIYRIYDCGNIRWEYNL